MLFCFGVFATALSIGPAIHYWQRPTLYEWTLLTGVGVLGALSQSFWIRSFRAGEASVVAPFDYLRLPIAATIGFVGFAELPTLWTFVGAGVIVGSTLYIAHREVQLRKRATTDPEPAVSGK